MKKLIIKEWNIFIENLKEVHNDLDKASFARMLLDWTLKIRDINNKYVQNLYDSYLSYFEKINVSEHIYDDTWFSLEKIFEYSFFRNKTDNAEFIIMTVSGVLDELLIYKSNIFCEKCERGDLRVYSNIQRTELFYGCDFCTNTLDIQGRLIDSVSIIIPATNTQIQEYKIKCSDG